MARMGSLPEKNFRTGANPALARDSFQRTAGHFPVEVKLGNTPQRQFVHLICLRLEILAVRVPALPETSACWTALQRDRQFRWIADAVLPRLSRQLNQIERLCFPVGHQRRQTPTLPLLLERQSRQSASAGWLICTLTVAFQRVREAKVTTDCYHWAFLREIRRGKYLILNWLPPRDSNPDMLIQRQEAGDSAEFPRFY